MKITRLDSTSRPPLNRGCTVTDQRSDSLDRRLGGTQRHHRLPTQNAINRRMLLGFRIVRRREGVYRRSQRDTVFKEPC